MAIRKIDKRKLPSHMTPSRAADELGVCKNTVIANVERHKIGSKVYGRRQDVAVIALTPSDVSFLASVLQGRLGRPKGSIQ